MHAFRDPLFWVWTCVFLVGSFAALWIWLTRPKYR